MLKSTACNPLPKGNAPNVSIDAMIMKKGAVKNKNLSDCLTWIISLIRIFTISATL